MMRVSYLSILLFVLGLMITPWSSEAGTIRFAWDFAGKDHDGFRIYYGKMSHSNVPRPLNGGNSPAPYDHVVTIPDPKARQHSLVLDPGAYYFRLTVFSKVTGDSDFTKNEPLGVVGHPSVDNFRILMILPHE